LDEEERKALRDRMQTRNGSILEHGDPAVQEEDALRCWAHAEGMRERVLES